MSLDETQKKKIGEVMIDEMEEFQRMTYAEARAKIRELKDARIKIIAEEEEEAEARIKQWRDQSTVSSWTTLLDDLKNDGNNGQGSSNAN